MVFNLLIFLLVSTTFKTREQAFIIELPTASHEEIIISSDKNLIFLTTEKEIFLYLTKWRSEGKPLKVNLEELKVELKKIADENKETPMSIRAEKETSFQALMDIINACYEAGLRQIELPYELKKE